MNLERGRDIVRGVLLLVSAALARWVDLTAGLALLVFMAVMIMQSAFTGWCPADLILRPMGLHTEGENLSTQPASRR